MGDVEIITALVELGAQLDMTDIEVSWKREKINGTQRLGLGIWVRV